MLKLSKIFHTEQHLEYIFRSFNKMERISMIMPRVAWKIRFVQRVDEVYSI